MNSMGVKKWISFLLAAAFVLGMIPLGTQRALADESVDVTLAVNDAAYGTLTSNPSELSGLAPGVQATLTATALKGYEFGSWSVTDGDGAATEDYTLVPDKSVQGKAVLTLGATDLIVTAVFKSILEGDGNFVNSANKDKPKVQINQGSTVLSTTSITGWNNSTVEPLVITFTVPRDLRELGNLQVWVYTKLMAPAPTYLAADAYYTFPDTSIEDATTVRKLTFTAEGWNWGEYAFTITDADGKVKPGKMIFKYAGLADIEAENGGVKIADTIYHTGDAHYFGTQGLVNDWKGILATVEAVPDVGYVFDGWEISGVSLGDASANPLTFTTPDAQPFTVRAKFIPKLSSVTLAVNDAAYGTLTSNPSPLSDLASGVQATLTAAALKGYEFGSWSVTDADGAATEDYTLVPDKNVPGKAVLTLGATDLIVTAVFKSILEGDGNFVNSANKDKPKVQINQGSTILSTTSITGWNNSTAEPLVITFTVPRDLRELENLQVWVYTKLMAPAPTYLAADAYYTFPDTSIEDATTVRKLTFTAEGWNWSEYAFTITDADGKVKPGKMIFKYAGLADIEVENGGVKIADTVYHTGDAHYFGTQGLVNDWKGILATMEAVPDAGYMFAGWEISGVSLDDASANPLTFTTPDAQPFSVRAKFAQTPRYTVSFRMMNGEESLTAWSNWAGKFGGIPYSMYLFDKDATFDEMLASPYSGVSQHADTTKDVQEYSIEQGGKVLFILHSYPAKGEYILDDIVTDAQAGDILGRVSIEDDIVRDGLIYRNGKAYLALTITGDVSVTANVHESAYTEIDTACDAAQGSLSITPVASTANLWLEGTKVMMRAVPKTGYRFKEWQETSGQAYLSQDQLTQSVVEFTVGQTSASFTAVFESAVSALRSVNKAASAADKATVLVNGSAQTDEAYEGSAVAISYADVDEYYLFDHWEVYQEGVSGAANLIPLVDREKKDVSFTMPYGEQGVRVTAVLKLRPYASLTCSVRESGGGQLAGVGAFAMSADGVPVSSGATVEKGKTVTFSMQVTDPAYVFKCWRIFKDKEGASGVQVKIFESEESEISYEMPWYHLYVWAVFEPQTPLNTNYDITLIQPDGGHAIAVGVQTARPTKTVALSATPAEGYQVKQWAVVLDADGTAVTVTPSQTNKNEATFVMPLGAVTVSAEFEEEPPAEAKIVDVQLLDGGGELVAQGALAEGTKVWTIELPGTISAAVAQAIPEGLSGLYLKVVASQDATVRQNDEGYGSYDDATGSSGSWASGAILCYMPLNQAQTFTVTARGGELSDEYTITILYDPGMPALSSGSAERTSDAAATVRFTSSEAGSYYYAVVNAGAAAPTVNTTAGGTSAVADENTIALTNLTAGARDIYIVVKNAQGGINEPYRISIPAFAGTGTLYDISASAPAGGTIAVSPARAAAGATVTVTVSPDAGKQMVAGSLAYTIAVAGGQTHPISGNTFVMPANPVTVTCQWETAAASVSGITGFSINGVQGVVNNSTGTITITMPYRTDVTALAPVITTNNVSALTPGSGETLDFSSPITYTATLTGGGTRTYIATVYVQSGGTADEMWDELTDFYNQVPWWRFAEEQYSYGRYPRYW